MAALNQSSFIYEFPRSIVSVPNGYTSRDGCIASPVTDTDRAEFGNSSNKNRVNNRPVARASDNALCACSFVIPMNAKHESNDREDIGNEFCANRNVSTCPSANPAIFNPTRSNSDFNIRTSKIALWATKIFPSNNAATSSAT